MPAIFLAPLVCSLEFCCDVDTGVVWIGLELSHPFVVWYFIPDLLLRVRRTLNW